MWNLLKSIMIARKLGKEKIGPPAITYHGRYVIFTAENDPKIYEYSLAREKIRKYPFLNLVLNKLHII